MSTTRCKLKCTEDGRLAFRVNETPHYRAKFSAEYSSDPATENGRFFHATPSVTLELVTKDKHFEAGKSYYVDFTEVGA